MKQFFKMFFASLLAMIVAGVVVVIVVVSTIVTIVSSVTTTDKPVSVSSGSVLRLDLGKRFPEQGMNNSLAMFTEGSSFSSGIYEVVQALEAAAEDADVAGVYLKLAPSPNGWATLQQLRGALQKFQASGKFVYAYGEQIPQSAYYVATAADSVFLNPVGSFELKGMYTSMAFFKGTLDKLDLQPEIFYAGKFKSATEPFRRQDASAENKVQIAALQQDLWDDFVSGVAEFTGSGADTVKRWVEAGSVQFPSDALEHRLVSGLSFYDEVEDLMRARTGRKEKEDIRFVDMDDYARKAVSRVTASNRRIAVVFAEGAIVDGKKESEPQIASADFVKTLRKVRDDEKIKAVVLRVNSPGGSALASEVILRELQLLREKKPLVVSMGDLAASGGYYIACQADSIFALPGTITGSIGVFSMYFNVEGLMRNKLGVTFDGVKNAPYADFPTFSRSMTASERQIVQRHVDTVYAKFKRRVLEGRSMSEAHLDTIAQGRIWSGTDALALGLVDGLGSIDRALQSAAAKAGIDDYKVVTYPEKSDKFESMMRQLAGSGSLTASVREAAESGVREEFTREYGWYQQFKSLNRMNGSVMMALPFTLDIR